MIKKMSKEANVGELEHLCGMPSEGLGPHLLCGIRDE